MATRSKKKKPVVYLSSAVSGCSEEQVRAWRDRVKKRWAKEFDFIDSVEGADGGERGTSPAGVLAARRLGIRRADGVLVYILRESAGVVHDMAYARSHGVPVVAADPLFQGGHLLSHYVDVREETEAKAMKSLRELIRNHSRRERVMKRNGREEPFDRAKIVQSIRATARAANRDEDLAVAGLFSRVMDEIVNPRWGTNGVVTTTAIHDAIGIVIERLESSGTAEASEICGMRDVWGRGKKASLASLLNLGRPARHGGIQDRPLRLRIFSQKSHATIWGKTVKNIDDIPGPAHRVFKEISRAEGIQEIRLTKMRKGPIKDDVTVDLSPSTSPGLIEGKCYDNGVKGQVQMFQIRVHDPDRVQLILTHLMDHLANVGLLLKPQLIIPGHRGHRFRRIADTIPKHPGHPGWGWSGVSDAG